MWELIKKMFNKNRKWYFFKDNTIIATIKEDGNCLFEEEDITGLERSFIENIVAKQLKQSNGYKNLQTLAESMRRKHSRYTLSQHKKHLGAWG